MFKKYRTKIEMVNVRAENSLFINSGCSDLVLLQIAPSPPHNPPWLKVIFLLNTLPINYCVIVYIIINYCIIVMYYYKLLCYSMYYYKLLCYSMYYYKLPALQNLKRHSRALKETPHPPVSTRSHWESSRSYKTLSEPQNKTL